jgi:succinylglutamate desuccinylase
MSEPAISFLDKSLGLEEVSYTFMAANSHWRWSAQGVLEITPTAPTDLSAVIISVGVHGDETVPIRLVDLWLDLLAKQTRAIRRPLLVVMANPEAVIIGKRFVSHNMNRLFSGAATGSSDGEHQRAAEIMDVVRQFTATYPAGMHFDMHSTIKPSDQDRFAVIPVDCQENDLSDLKHWLADFSADAWVQNISPAAAFSSFTARLGYNSATVELGQVSRLDEPVDRFLSLLPSLDRLVFGDESKCEHSLTGFQVIDEIIRPAGEFEVCLQEFVNFRPLLADTLIARGDKHEWRIAETGDALLFLNADVPVGHRVGLVIRQR